MDASAVVGEAPRRRSDESELPRWRLSVLRATYALIAFGMGLQIVPPLLDHAALDRGVIPSLLAGMCLVDLLGIRYPRRMLPMLLFELAWKATWILFYGLPQWRSGLTPSTFAGDFQAIAAGVILMPIVIPWGYVWRHYVRAAGDRWR